MTESNFRNNRFCYVDSFSDVVMSSRIRLARNIKDFKFLNQLGSNEKKQIISRVKDVFDNINLGQKEKAIKFIDMEKISNIEALSMAEKHIISYDMATNPKNRAVFVSEDQTISIMVNEEDHIRLQFFSGGFELYDIYEQAQKIDALLDERLKYAFDSDLGYLTECLTNIGTGMRVSVLVHLLALDRCGALGKIANTLSKLGFVVRGSFGEGSKVKGAFYQISNQVTLGLNEISVIENLKSVVHQIIAQERAARKSLFQNDVNFQDSVMRAFGIIKYAKIINYEEFLELASLVRVGICEKFISESEVDLKTINYLINNLGPANVSLNSNQNSKKQNFDGSETGLLAHKRDVLRASIIAQYLK